MSEVWERRHSGVNEASLLCIDDTFHIRCVDSQLGSAWDPSYQFTESVHVARQHMLRDAGFSPSKVTVEQFDCLYNLFSST